MHLSWIVHRLASSNMPTNLASATCWSAIIAVAVHQSLWLWNWWTSMSWQISLTKCWKVIWQSITLQISDIFWSHKHESSWSVMVIPFHSTCSWSGCLVTHHHIIFFPHCGGLCCFTFSPLRKGLLDCFCVHCIPSRHFSQSFD